MKHRDSTLVWMDSEGWLISRTSKAEDATMGGGAQREYT